MPEPSASMLNDATIEKAERNEISNCARDMFKFVQNNYNFNMEELPDLIKHFINVVPHFLTEVRKNDSPGPAFSETTGAHSSDPHTESTYNTPQSSILEPVVISDMVPANPSSLPVTSIADRYTRSMLKCLAGYPLYNPKPLSELSKEYLRNGTNVGDVGFVRGNGTFDFLFNICPSQNGSINPPKLPNGFSLSALDYSAITDLDPLLPQTCLFHSPVTKTSSGEYTCEGPEGAVLELPEGAIEDEAMNMLPFENLAAHHGVEWYKYTMSRGRAISNGSLYLITSVTKCTQWGIAVFDRHCASGQGLRFDSESSFPFSFWKSPSRYRWKGPNLSNTKVSNPNQESALNQCVLLRGYKIMIRQDIFDNLREEQRRRSHTPIPSSSQAESSPTRQKASRIRGGGGTDPSLRRRSPFTQTTKSAVTEADKVVLYANFNSSLIHPSDLINVALLGQNPDAKVALTHDDIWCNLLRDNFPEVNYTTLIKIARSYTGSVDEYGCVSLKKVSDSTNVFNIEKSGHPVRGIEIQDLQDSSNSNININIRKTEEELEQEERRLKDKAEEIRKKEKEIERREEETLQLAEEMRQKAAEIKRREENLKKQEEEVLELRELESHGREQLARLQEEQRQHEQETKRRFKQYQSLVVVLVFALLLVLHHHHHSRLLSYYLSSLLDHLSSWLNIFRSITLFFVSVFVLLYLHQEDITSGKTTVLDWI